MFFAVWFEEPSGVIYRYRLDGRYIRRPELPEFRAFLRRDLKEKRKKKAATVQRKQYASLQAYVLPPNAKTKLETKREIRKNRFWSLTQASCLGHSRPLSTLWRNASSCWARARQKTCKSNTACLPSLCQTCHVWTRAKKKLVRIRENSDPDPWLKEDFWHLKYGIKREHKQSYLEFIYNSIYNTSSFGV